ncbi:MAG: hypothetical protein AAB849_02860 [Patescibacteria group bacterium]
MRWDPVEQERQFQQTLAECDQMADMAGDKWPVMMPSHCRDAYEAQQERIDREEQMRLSDAPVPAEE